MKAHHCVSCGDPVYSRNGGRKFCSPNCYFEHHVQQKPGCWGWTGRKNGDGYGRVRIEERSIGAHRFSYEKFMGPVPKGYLVCHTCDNPICTNPKHFFLGTDLDNARDAQRKNRNRKSRNKGSTNPNAKLDERKVRQILDAKGTLREIGRMFGISESTVSVIKRRLHWKHVR